MGNSVIRPRQGGTLRGVLPPHALGELGQRILQFNNNNTEQASSFFLNEQSDREGGG